MSRRIDRVEEACKEELAEILEREVKDPRIGFVTITRVKVTKDLGHAQVFISILGNEEEARDTLAGLESARGVVRSHLGKHLRLKFLPELEFIRERVAEEALRLDDILKRSREENHGGD